MIKRLHLRLSTATFVAIICSLLPPITASSESALRRPAYTTTSYNIESVSSERDDNSSWGSLFPKTEEAHLGGNNRRDQATNEEPIKKPKVYDDGDKRDRQPGEPDAIPTDAIDRRKRANGPAGTSGNNTTNATESQQEESTITDFFAFGGAQTMVDLVPPQGFYGLGRAVDESLQEGEGVTTCDGREVNILTDLEHCGACGVVCPRQDEHNVGGDMYCNMGRCTFEYDLIIMNRESFPVLSY